MIKTVMLSGFSFY